MVILVDGHHDAHTAKTAQGILRYRPEEVVAVLDAGHAGATAERLLGIGGAIPVVATLDEAPSADTLLVGIAPPGGRLPPSWRRVLLEACRRGWTVISGLHDFLRDDPRLSAAAEQHGATLIDLRDNDEHEVATGGREFRPDCLRVLTVAADCSSGKMVATAELARGLQAVGVDARMVATGQTGMLVAGDGVAVDRVAADFLAGAAERLVLANQSHDVLIVEGQGSLFHPRYSGVTLSLLHGVRPRALVLVHPMGRTEVRGMPGVRLPSPHDTIRLHETMAALLHPAQAIGVAVNGGSFTDEQVEAECGRLEDELQLPACDCLRHGPGKLVDAVRQLAGEGSPAAR